MLLRILISLIIAVLGFLLVPAVSNILPIQTNVRAACVTSFSYAMLSSDGNETWVVFSTPGNFPGTPTVGSVRYNNKNYPIIKVNAKPYAVAKLPKVNSLSFSYSNIGTNGDIQCGDLTASVSAYDASQDPYTGNVSQAGFEIYTGSDGKFACRAKDFGNYKTQAECQTEADRRNNTFKWTISEDSAHTIGCKLSDTPNPSYTYNTQQECVAALEGTVKFSIVKDSNGINYCTLDPNGSIKGASSCKSTVNNQPNTKPGVNLCAPTPVLGQAPQAATECKTALGNIPIDAKGLTQRILQISLGLAGGIALIFMVYGSIKILTSSGDPKKIGDGRDIIVAAVAGLLFLIFSVLLLKYIGLTLLPTNPF